MSDDAYKDEWMTLACRYKNMNDNESYITKWAVGKANYTKHPDKDFKFAASVAEYGMILNKSDYIDKRNGLFLQFSDYTLPHLKIPYLQ